tara:strand:+ start:1420 stop:2043 length:624 start_codon:yes stop_codon:yes gene_type:complete
MQINNPTYYAVIPANVRYSSIRPNAKLLYGEITCLSNKFGYCYATNNYFANLYNVSKNTVSLWFKELKVNNFITIEMVYGDNKQVIKRKVSIIEKGDTPININNNNNITRFNNTSKNISNRALDFKNEVFYNKNINLEVLENFYDYWSESNKLGSKMKFEMEKTWNTDLRLKRWVKNNQKWNVKSKSKIELSNNSHLDAKKLINNLI